MKKTLFLLILLLCTLAVKAQLVYHDAVAFPLLGKASTCTATRYERLPDSLRHISRPPLWGLGQNSAGLAIRFRSNSRTIAAKWEVRHNSTMNHMTPTGIKGLDLYCLQDGKWVFANSGRPSGKVNSAIIISNMKPDEREYLLYLPLYDGITSLSIGVDSLSQLSQPKENSPIHKKPIVFYGTSILQGGCASRPGMAHTNILSRWLNRECINLGFSGNAFLDLEIAKVMADIDAAVFVLDFLPNASIEQMKKRADQFYMIIRSRHPHTPIVFVEDPVYTHTRFDQFIDKEVKRKNEAIRVFYESLKRRGEKHIQLVSSKNMLGSDGEATVDGVHFTDLGMMRYAELMYSILKKNL